jgi:hypothetical protein
MKLSIQNKEKKKTCSQLITYMQQRTAAFQNKEKENRAAVSCCQYRTFKIKKRKSDGRVSCC